jgi:hypothetical protein
MTHGCLSLLLLILFAVSARGVDLHPKPREWLCVAVASQGFVATSCGAHLAIECPRKFPSVSSSLNSGDELLACPRHLVDHFATWKVATTMHEPQELALKKH